MEERIATLRRILDESSCTVALCGSGMMEEGGYIGVKNPDKAYDIEKKYGSSHLGLTKEARAHLVEYRLTPAITNLLKELGFK